MNNKNHQQLNEAYMKQYLKLYPMRSIYPSYYLNMLESSNSSSNGFIKISIIDKSDNSTVSNAAITIYVTDGSNRNVPVIHLITTINPIKIELPMANELGTKIVGPEYNFSTYDLRIDAFGYFSYNMYNIRLFPNTTTDVEIGLIKVSQPQEEPYIEERINIPPHPRDEINNRVNS